MEGLVMNSKILLSIVIPCYNEAENLKQGALTEVFNYLQTVGFTWELIVSDDGSSDNSRELVRAAIAGISDAYLLENPHGGKPAAILAGIRKARGEYLLFTDMDQSTPLTELEKFLPFFSEYDVIIGARKERKNFPLYRRIGSKVFRTIRKSLLLGTIDDTQCGFKVFRTELAGRLFPQLLFFQEKTRAAGWKVTAFDVELLYLAQTAGHAIKEIFVEWEDRDRTAGKQKSYLKESAEMFCQVLKVKFNAWRGLYK
jgi:dolichyl-phosphate beta-glucosyltransferase